MTMQHNRYAIAVRSVVFVLLGAFAIAAAEVVTLKDGTKVSGTITEQTSSEITVKTLYGTLKIDKSSIASIDYGGAPEPAPTLQPQTEVPSPGEYNRGYSDGEDKGYDEGLRKAQAEQKSARLTGSLLGWLLWAVVVVVAVLASSGY